MAKIVELSTPEITLLPSDADTVFKVIKPCVVELPLVRRNSNDNNVEYFEFWVMQGASIEFIAENGVKVYSYKDYSFSDESGAAIVVERWSGHEYAIAGLIEKRG